MVVALAALLRAVAAVSLRAGDIFSPLVPTVLDVTLKARTAELDR